MKWFKKNKFTTLAIIIFVLLAILGYKAKEIFFPNQRSAIYGDRLEGKVNVKESTYKELENKIKESDKVIAVNITETGKRIDIVITVTDSTSKSEAKKLTDNMLEPFTESQIGYYDFQVFVKKESKSENDFPIIGYKQHNSSSFSWSKDRDKTEEDGE